MISVMIKAISISILYRNQILNYCRLFLNIWSLINLIYYVTTSEYPYYEFTPIATAAAADAPVATAVTSDAAAKVTIAVTGPTTVQAKHTAQPRQAAHAAHAIHNSHPAVVISSPISNSSANFSITLPLFFPLTLSVK